MTVKELIKIELNSVKKWTDLMIKDIDQELWLETPKEFGTNINWIIGHIMHDKYWHGIGCVKKPSKEFSEKFDINNFAKYYSKDSKPLEYMNEKPSPKEILNALDIVDEEVHSVIDNIDMNELNEPPIIHNPVAKTKYSSIFFCVKHQMWHNGQIAMLKRVLHS